MNRNFLQTLLAQLTPSTLARIMVDIEQAQADWASFPETAPSLEDQQAIIAALPLIRHIGETQARDEALDFAELIEQAQTKQAETDWQTERDRQEVDNWLNDFD